MGTSKSRTRASSTGIGTGPLKESAAGSGGHLDRAPGRIRNGLARHAGNVSRGRTSARHRPRALARGEVRRVLVADRHRGRVRRIQPPDAPSNRLRTGGPVHGRRGRGRTDRQEHGLTATRLPQERTHRTGIIVECLSVPRPHADRAAAGMTHLFGENMDLDLHPSRLSFSNKPIPFVQLLKVPFVYTPLPSVPARFFDFISRR